MKKRAFSLIEMIIYVAILAILASVLTFKLNFLETFKAKQQIKELAINIDSLKNYSMMTGGKVQVIFFDDGYKIIKNNTKEFIKFEKFLKVIDNNIDQISFDRYGKPVSYIFSKNSTGTINFKIKNKTIKLTVSPITGVVNIYE